MSKNIVTYKTYENEISSIETNLNNNIELAKSMLEDFESKMDDGDFADLALHHILKENFTNALKARTEFYSLPISGYLSK